MIDNPTDIILQRFQERQNDKLEDMVRGTSNVAVNSQPLTVENFKAVIAKIEATPMPELGPLDLIMSGQWVQLPEFFYAPVPCKTVISRQWHKRRNYAHRVNKKWRKEYGFKPGNKRDTIIVDGINKIIHTDISVVKALADALHAPVPTQLTIRGLQHVIRSGPGLANLSRSAT